MDFERIYYECGVDQLVDRWAKCGASNSGHLESLCDADTDQLRKYQHTSSYGYLAEPQPYDYRVSERILSQLEETKSQLKNDDIARIAASLRGVFICQKTKSADLTPGHLGQFALVPVPPPRSEFHFAGGSGGGGESGRANTNDVTPSTNLPPLSPQVPNGDENLQVKQEWHDPPTRRPTSRFPPPHTTTPGAYQTASPERTLLASTIGEFSHLSPNTSSLYPNIKLSVSPPRENHPPRNSAGRTSTYHPPLNTPCRSSAYHHLATPPRSEGLRTPPVCFSPSVRSEPDGQRRSTRASAIRGRGGAALATPGRPNRSPDAQCVPLLSCGRYPTPSQSQLDPDPRNACGILEDCRTATPKGGTGRSPSGRSAANWGSPSTHAGAIARALRTPGTLQRLGGARTASPATIQYARPTRGEGTQFSPLAQGTPLTPGGASEWNYCKRSSEFEEYANWQQTQFTCDSSVFEFGMVDSTPLDMEDM